MRNLKKLLAVVVAVALVLTSMTAAFAATNPQADAIAALKLMQGNNGDMMLEEDLARDQAVKIIITLTGKAAEVDALSAADVDAALAGFADAAALKASWSAKWYAYAVKNGIITGYNNEDGDLVTDFAGPLYGKQFATMLMKAFGYKDVDYATSVTKLSELDGSKVADEKADDSLTRADAIAYLFGSLTAKNADGKTVVETYVGSDAALLKAAQDAGLIAAPATLGVSKVTADNLKTLKVEFTKPIDNKSVTSDTFKVTYDGNAITFNSDDVKISEDKKTIVYVYPVTVLQSKTVKLEINGIKDADKNEIKGYANSIVVTDTVIPTVTGAAALNAKQIEVFFSEPINFSASSFQVLNDVKLNGVAMIAKAEVNYLKNSIVLTSSTVIPAGTHKVTLSNMTDFATYKAVTAEFTVTIVEDKVAPKVISAEATSVNEVVVTFDENLESAGTIKINGDVATQTKVDGAKVTLTPAKALDLAAIVEVKVAYKDQTDMAGNKVTDEQTFTFKVADDTALPSVTSSVEDGNKVVLTFSKSMNTTLGTITVKDKDSKTVATLNVSALTFKADTSNKVLELAASATKLDNVNPAKYTFEIKDMKDATIRANLLPATTLTIDAKDTLKPTVTGTYFAKNGDKIENDTVTFYFSEAMNVETLKNLSNYVGSTIGSLAAYDGASVDSVAADAKSITIKVKNFRTLVGETFTVYALKDAAGNMLASTAGVSKLSGTTLSVSGSAISSETTKVKIEFNTKIATADPAAYKVIDATTTSDVAVFIAYSIADDGMSVTFTANKDLSTNPSKYMIKDNYPNLIKNIYGETATTNSGIIIIDKIAPTVALDTDGTSAGAIKLTFSEAVTASASDLANNIIVKDKDGKIVTPTMVFFNDKTEVASTAAFDKIVFTGLNSGDNYTVTVIGGRGIVDAAGNKIADMAATTKAAK